MNRAEENNNLFKVNPAPIQARDAVDNISFPFSYARGNDGKRDGFVLAAILALLGVIVALVLQAQVFARSCLNLGKAGMLKAQLRETACDAAWRALHVLAADGDLLIDHTNESWAIPIRFSLPNGIETEAVVRDDNRFIDANILGIVSLSEQRRPAGAVVRDALVAGNWPKPEMRTQIIQDWVDQDQHGSYEKPYYRSIKSSVDAPDACLESREELCWLMGAATNAAAAPIMLSVLPGHGQRMEPVNVNTAGRETLLALFGEGNAGIVESIISARAATPISGLSQVADAESLKWIQAYLSVKSSYFSVHAFARMGALAEDVYCLARRDDFGNVQVIRWVEH